MRLFKKNIIVTYLACNGKESGTLQTAEADLTLGSGQGSELVM